jgi:hypothetical protein
MLFVPSACQGKTAFYVPAAYSIRSEAGICSWNTAGRRILIS